MKKVSKFSIFPFHFSIFTILLLGGGLLVSCNNFLDGGDFKEQLEKDIAYANAKSIPIIISPEEGTGSTDPAGSRSVKQGYPFEVSFSEAPGWSFVRWVAVSKSAKFDRDGFVEIEGVLFDDASSLKTKATVKTDSEDVRLMPLCTDRIAVLGEPNPKYDANGVSRDRSVIVEFTKVPAKSSFTFSHSEIPEDALPVKNLDDEIWAYTRDGETFFKNISITNADGYSLADHFTQPVLDGKLLTISVDRENPIEFEAGVTLKTVLVTLSENISDTDGVCMTAEKSWRYQINESTDEKATVSITCDSQEGSLYLSGAKDYSIGQKVTLAFTENADWQFIKWEYDENFVHLADEKSVSTTATVINRTDSEAAVIRAACAPRLRVTEFSPVGGTSKTASKNSSVILKFSHDLPDDSGGKAQLSNIMITMGGSPVKSSFLEPVISGDTLTFAADKSNMLDVAAGQTKTVTVSVPADFYYLLEDGTKVTYGGTGISFDYKIDETTLDKAEITFASNSGSGTITTSAGSPAGTNTYSEGQEITVTFSPSADWQFNGWSISAGGNEVGEDKIRISDKSAPTTKLTVVEAVQGVTVRAEASEKLSVTATSPSEAENPKDASIEITFNKALDSACSELLPAIKVFADGANVDSNFAAEKRTLSGSKITLKNTKHLSVSEGMTKTVTVTIPNSFYYADGSVKVPLEQDYSFSYVVDGSSSAKAEVTFAQTANAGTVSPAAGSTQQYSLDREVPLSFVPASGYQFNGWSILDSNKNEVDSGEIRIEDKRSASTTMYVYGEARGITVRANASEKLSVTGTAPTAQTNPKDSSITITFNKDLASDCDSLLNKIKVTLDGANVDSYFAERTLNGNKITLKNTKYLNVADNETKTVAVTVPSFFYYMDGDVRVSLAENYDFDYSIKNETTGKSHTTFTAQAGSGTLSAPDGTNNEFSMDMSISISFAQAEGYKFEVWQASSVALPEGEEISDYVVFSDATSPETLVTFKKPLPSIIITPVCPKLPSVKFSLTGSNGKFSPTKGEHECVKTYTYPLSFEADSDYEFIRWEIFDSKSGNSIENGKYITVENPEANETTYSFATELEDSQISLAIRPLVAERPQILSYSPLYVAVGVLKDSTIQLVFDYDMDEDSIYYTEDELKELAGVTLLASTKNPGKYYGYKKSVSDSSGSHEEYFYKNISFKDNETYENRTASFDEPYFASPRTISVNTRKPNTVVNYSQILVTIEKDFFYKVENGTECGRKVSMAGSKKWIYQVNDSVDTVKPRIANADSDIKVSVKTDRALSTSTALSSLASVPSVSTDTNFNRNKKISLNIKVTDSESGPSNNFILNLIKVQDENYQSLTVPETTRKPFNYQKVTSLNGVFSKELDLASIVEGGLSDGVYKVSFEFSDRSGNTLTYPENGAYYFTVDNEIKMAEPVFEDTTDSSKIKMKFNWTPSADLAKTELRYKKKSESEWSVATSFDSSTSTKEYDSLSLATDYDFEITNYDFAGNTQKYEFEKTTADWTVFTVSEPNKNVYLKGESFDKNSITVTFALSNGKSWEINDYSTDFTSSSLCISGKNVKISHSYNGVSKSLTLPATYYVAASDALTQTPVKLTGYSGTAGESGTYYKFGDFPQTIASNQNSSFYTAETVYHGWYFGNDGYFYAKCAENAYEEGYTYSSGSAVAQASANSEKYFKVEPLKWRKLTDDYYNRGTVLLLSEKAIDGNIPFYCGENRSISGGGGKNIMWCTYPYSTVRAYLNGAYNSDDTQTKTYEGCGFLQKAFTDASQNLINTTLVLNNEASAKPVYVPSGTTAWNENYFARIQGDSVYDKIFLLSEHEATDYDLGKYSDYSAVRKREPTDFAKANHSQVNSDSGLYADWWLRTPYNNTDFDYGRRTRIIYNGRSDSSVKSDVTSVTIVPALTVNPEVLE